MSKMDMQLGQHWDGADCVSRMDIAIGSGSEGKLRVDNGHVAG